MMMIKRVSTYYVDVVFDSYLLKIKIHVTITFLKLNNYII